MYCTTMADSFPTEHPPPQSHSGVPRTLPLSRKRTRSSILQLHPNQNHLDFTSFLGEDISLMMQIQQREIHDFIAHHVSINYKSPVRIVQIMPINSIIRVQIAYISFLYGFFHYLTRKVHINYSFKSYFNFFNKYLNI